MRVEDHHLASIGGETQGGGDANDAGADDGDIDAPTCHHDDSQIAPDRARFPEPMSSARICSARFKSACDRAAPTLIRTA